MSSHEQLKDAIRNEYGSVARKALSDLAGAEELPVLADGGCCGSGADSCCGESAGLYAGADVERLPAGARSASRGCGNPVALASLAPGQAVLDLGAGGGIDVLLAAEQVGAEGRVIGLDMTDDMLVLARENARRAGAANVEFIKGEIEAIPLPDQSVDVIISNCVINLTMDKGQTLVEAFRVLRPGGRLAVSDIVFPGDPADIPPPWRRNAELWAGCVSGALGAAEYASLLAAAGFTDIDVDVARSWQVGGVAIGSAYVSARRPD